MSLPILDTNPASVFAPLVTFQWGASSVARYCRWTDDLVIGGNTYLAEPSFEWSFETAPNSGTEDSPLTVQMRANIAPFVTGALPYPHSKITALIEEISPGDTTKTEIFRGRVQIITVKPNGQQGLVKAKVVGTKARLTGDLGITATSTCAWTFGNQNGSPCGIDLGAITESATVSEINKNGKANRIVLAFAGAPSMSNARWKNGYVQYDNLRIVIRKSIDDGTYRFDLREMPPPSWLGKTVAVVPGCDQQLSRCQYWNNVSRFLAIGRAMPLRNPVFEG